MRGFLVILYLATVQAADVKNASAVVNSTRNYVHSGHFSATETLDDLEIPCTSDKQCPVQHAICDKDASTCRCDLEFPIAYLDDRPVCLPASKINETCVIDRQCQLSDRNRHCASDGTCQCDSQTSYLGYRCVSDLEGLNRPCQADTECILHVPNSACLCNNGEFSQYCGADSWGQCSCAEPFFIYGEGCENYQDEYAGIGLKNVYIILTVVMAIVFVLFVVLLVLFITFRRYRTLRRLFGVDDSQNPFSAANNRRVRRTSSPPPWEQQAIPQTQHRDKPPSYEEVVRNSQTYPRPPAYQDLFENQEAASPRPNTAPPVYEIGNIASPILRLLGRLSPRRSTDPDVAAAPSVTISRTPSGASSATGGHHEMTTTISVAVQVEVGATSTEGDAVSPEIHSKLADEPPPAYHNVAFDEDDC